MDTVESPGDNAEGGAAAESDAMDTGDETARPQSAADRWEQLREDGGQTEVAAQAAEATTQRWARIRDDKGKAEMAADAAIEKASNEVCDQ